MKCPHCGLLTDMPVGYADDGPVGVGVLPTGISTRDYLVGQALANPHIAAHTTGGALGLMKVCYEFADAARLAAQLTSQPESESNPPATSLPAR